MLLENSTYKFKFIKLPLFFNNGSECDVVLLVDEKEFIHDYRVRWSKFCITEYTTATHFIGKPTERFKFRDELLSAIGMEHKPNPEHNKRKIYSDPVSEKQLKIINNLFFNNWIGQTFGNIAYVLTGSNTSGEGDPKQAEYRTKLGKANKLFAIGMFLQAMKLKSVVPELNTRTYKDLWNEDVFNQEMQLFNDWVKQIPSLDAAILWFNSEMHKPEQWKLQMTSLKNQFLTTLSKTKYEQTITKIKTYRQQLAKDLISKEISFKNFWGFDAPNEIGFEIEYAHIKPVWLIKREYLASNDFHKEHILNEVKDVNNVIPLDSDSHFKYDSYQIYWDLSGRLNVLKTFNKKNIRKYVIQLPPDKVIDIKHYLNEYIKKVLIQKTDKYMLY